MTYFADHWHGRHTLWQAYWLNTVIGPMIASFVLTSLLMAAPSVMMALLIMIAVAAMTVWGLVGTWASATAYIDEHTYPRAFLGWLAYAAVCLGWIKMLVALFALGS